MQVTIDITQWTESDFLGRVVQAAAEKLFNEMRDRAHEAVKAIVREEYGSQLRRAVSDALAARAGLPRKVDGQWTDVSVAEFVDAYLKGEINDYRHRPRVEEVVEKAVDKQMPEVLAAFVTAHRDELVRSAMDRVVTQITDRLR